MTKPDKIEKRPPFKDYYLNYVSSFVKNLALMADVLNELKSLSETLQNRNTTLLKADIYSLRIQNE